MEENRKVLIGAEPEEVRLHENEVNALLDTIIENIWWKEGYISP